MCQFSLSTITQISTPFEQNTLESLFDLTIIHMIQTGFTNIIYTSKLDEIRDQHMILSQAQARSKNILSKLCLQILLSDNNYIISNQHMI